MKTQLWVLGYSEYEQELKRKGKVTPWTGLYDMAHVFIIEADTEANARQLAADQCGDEGREAWLNPQWSECVPLKLDGRNCVWCRDFVNG